MKKKFYIIGINYIFILFLMGCSISSNKYRTLTTHQGHYTPKHLEYFLTGIPSWYSHSQTGKCTRIFPTKYLNIEKLRKSFNFSYQESLQFQFLYNKQYASLEKSSLPAKLSINDEEKIFFKTKSYIEEKYFPFSSPSYKRVHLIWIDKAINNKTILKSLKKMVSKEYIFSGYPIIISQCLSYNEALSFMEQHFKNLNAKIISQEMFSIYDDQNNFNYELSIKLNHFFSKKQKIILFLPKGITPPEIQGRFATEYY